MPMSPKALDIFRRKELSRLIQVCQRAMKEQSSESLKVAACEEMAELSQVLCRSVNKKKVKSGATEEEIADVFIMVQQMVLLYFKTDEQFLRVLKKKLTKRETKFAASKLEAASAKPSKESKDQSW